MSKETKKVEAEEKKVVEQKKIGVFKKGDHMVHVLLQTGRKFLSVSNEKAVNLQVEVQVGSQKQYFTCKNDVLTDSEKPIVWNEHLYFTLQDLTPDDANELQISIRALNKGFFRNELVGEMTFTLSSIYFKDQHKVEHAWFALENSQSPDISKIYGMLKASFSVQGPKDEQVKLEFQEGLDSSAVLFMSAQAQRSFKQLRISVLEAQDLPLFSDVLAKMKNFSLKNTVEPFFTCSYTGKEMKTEVKMDGKIDQTFFIPVPQPTMNDRLLITAYDENISGRNLIGSIQFSVNDIAEHVLETKSGFYVWRDIYGAHPDFDHEEAKSMNMRPETGNQWKGRVLLHIACDDTTKPEKKVSPMDPQIRKDADGQQLFNKENFQMWLDIGQGIGMPDDSPYQVQVKIRNIDVTTQLPKTNRNNYKTWSERIKRDFQMVKLNGGCPISSPSDEVFIYLLKDQKPVAYRKFEVSEFNKSEAEWRWVAFEKCPIHDSIKHSHLCGMVNIKLSIVCVSSPAENQQPLAASVAWKDDPFSKGKFRYTNKNVRCYIFQCRGLPPADTNGQSDPFVKISDHFGADATTPVIEDNLNPIFLCSRTVSMEFRSRSDMENTPIIMSIFDADEGLFNDSADFLGRSVIFLKDASYNSNPLDVPVPKWHKIQTGVLKNSPACGEILASFCVYEPDHPKVKKDDEVNLANEIKKKEFKLRINVLGLRNLKSNGLLPVKKAFLKLQVRTLLPPQEQLSVEDKIIAASESGTNPNFNQTIELSLNLPYEKLYTPALTCMVMDQVFIGFSQPVLGSFQIPIGDLIQEHLNQNSVQEHKAKKIIEYLQAILERDAAPESLKIISPTMVKLDIWYSKTVQSATKKNQSATKPGGIELKQMDGPKAKDEDPIDEPNDDCEEDPINVDLGILKDVGDQEKEIDEKWSEEEKLAAKKMNYLIRQKLKLLVNAQRKKDVQDLVKSNHWTPDDSIVIPHYSYDNMLSCYREVPNKFPIVFKEVGYNDQLTIKHIQEHYALYKAATDPSEKAASYAEILAETNRHLRRYYKDELENNRSIFPKMPFKTFDIRYGQSRGLKSGGLLSLFSKQDKNNEGEITNEKVVGQFKGIVEVINEKEEAEFKTRQARYMKQICELLEQIYQKNASEEAKARKPALGFTFKELANAEGRQRVNKIFNEIRCNFTDLMPFLTSHFNQHNLNKLLKTKSETLVHLYVLEGFDLASRDIGSPSDPYFTVQCGSFKWDNRARYVLDDANPKWHEHVQFPVTFPGSKPLVIDCYDYDDLFGDDLIGSTIIDLDDRFFTPEWNYLEEKPIEQRQLYHPSTALSQGVIEMWLDIIPQTKVGTASSKVWNISPEPTQEFEVRVCVLGCRDVPNMDIEGTTDAYIRAFISDDSVQETDTHYRCTTGNPNFNYRLKFNVKTPFVKSPLLSLQLWDRDLIKSNDLICEWVLDLSEIVEDSQLTGSIMCLQEKYYEKSLMPRLVDKKDVDGNPIPFKAQFKFVKKPQVGTEGYVIELETRSSEEPEKPVYIQLDVRVFPIDKAKLNPAGQARDQPNQEPFLPEPQGRFQLSLNPFTMLNQMCGPKLRCKIYCVVFSILCVVLGIYFLPFIASIIQIVTNLALTAKK